MLKTDLFKDPRWFSYLLVGGLCFGANLLVLYICTGLLGIHYFASMLISIPIANTLGWLLNRNWTFSSSRGQWAAEYIRYLTVNLGSYSLSLLLMVLCVSVLKMHYLLSSGIIAVALTIINFSLHRSWSFTKNDHTDRRS